MGLAEPRKRIKLSHDPRNLAWSQAPDSFGARIMQSSGWKPGTALGASSIPAHEASAAKVKITVKDDMLGLGASLKSKSVEHQRTGLDAFQGLLGRLNAKDEVELQKVEQRIENKKLAMFAQGRWGGMVFVPGGLLVQENPAEIKIEPPPSQQDSTAKVDDVDMSSSDDSRSVKAERKRKRAQETPEEKLQRKTEKKQRKEERRARKEAKKLKKLQNASGTSTPRSEDVTMTESSNTGTSTPTTDPVSRSSTPLSQSNPRTGRHLLRGRNIQAKRMAFSDSKGLDQIFMRQQQQQTA